MNQPVASIPVAQLPAHSSVPPSSASKWIVCHGSPRMEQLNPQEDTQDLRDGRAAHWLAEQCLMGWREYADMGGTLGLPALPAADLDPMGTAITEEIRDSARMYVEDVIFAATQCQENWQLEVEWRLEMPRIHPQCFGTLDTALITPTKIILWDFKHGHEEVSPVWNWQMLCYLAGILDALDIDGHMDQRLQVEFRIVQPRCYTSKGPIRSFSFTASDARAHFNQLNHAAHQALGEDPQCIPGPHCKHCSAAHACPAERKAAYFAVDYAGSAIPEALTAEGLAFELELFRFAEKVMAARKEAVVAEATARAERGEFIPGFVLEPNFGKRAWINASAPTALGAFFGTSLMEEKPVSPYQAINKLKPLGCTEDIINQYATRKSLPPKLVSAKDSDAPRILSKPAN